MSCMKQLMKIEPVSGPNLPESEYPAKRMFIQTIPNLVGAAK